jgi:hypothetical protein
MPFSNIGALACQNLQTDLVDFYGRNSPQFRTNGSTSLIKWLLSPQNTSNFQRINVTSIPGKKRAVAFRLVDPYCFDLCRAARACATPAGIISQTPNEIVYDLNIDPYRPCDGEGAPLALKIDLEDLEQYCTLNDMTWITDQISRFLFRFEEQLDKNLLTLLEPLVGTNFNAEAISTVPMFVNNSSTNTAAINPEGQFALNQLMLDIGIDGQYGVVGGAIVRKLAMYLKWATANDAGIDLSKFAAVDPFVFYDRNADTILATTDWLQLAAGAVQLVTWNRYAPGSSIRKTVTDLYTKGTITLPTTGLEIDYNWTFDYTCNVWNYEPILYADLAVVPAGGCSTEGVNGIIRVQDCSAIAVIPECAGS